MIGGFSERSYAAGGAEVTPLGVPGGRGAGFTRLAPETTGVAFTNRLSDEAAAANQIRLNGSGVALGDVNGDGRIDVFLCGLETENQLFINLGGWRFQPAPDADGARALGLPGRYCTGAALADLDGDGDLDLLINALGEGTRQFVNDGHGRFQSRPDAGLESRGGATSMALADVDGDGDLDLYVTNYRTSTIRTTGFPLLNVEGKRVVPRALRDDLELGPDGRVLEHGEPDCFYLNDGTGRFERVPWTTGGFLDEEGRPLTRIPRDWGLSVVFRDIDQDGRPDLYVCNDFHSMDGIWLNVEGRQFRAMPRRAVRHVSTFSMGVDFADLDRDGWDDFFLSDMLDLRRERRVSQITATEPQEAGIGEGDARVQYDRNTLHWNRGDGTYAEVAYFAGLDRSGWSWATVFLDVDLDGYEDLLLTTGHLFDTQDLDAAAAIERGGPYRRDQIARNLLRFPRLLSPKIAFRNLGGLRFAEMGERWGFSDVGVSHGMALGDLDGDGDLDVVVNNLNAAAGLYRNEAAAPRVLVSLRGQAPNTAAIGARVSLISSRFTQSQEIMAGGRYLSSDAPQRAFAWPPATSAAQLQVAWPSGRVTRLGDVRPNHRYVLAEPAEPADVSPSPADRRPGRSGGTSAPLFADRSERLRHVHVETLFDDFARQPLLPHRLSQPGPGVALHDLDGDGSDDVCIGAGAGGQVVAFRGDGRGGFQPMPPPASAAALGRDATALAGDPLNPRRLLVAMANYEDGQTNGVSVRRWDWTAGVVEDVLPDFPWSVETLAAGDVDGDGDLDLLVAGRCVPGRYPEPAGASLWLQEGGRWVADRTNAAALGGVGMVSGALWTDLDGNGSADLALACEWGPLRLFRNVGGRLVPWNPPVRTPPGSGLPAGTLANAAGRWTTLVGGDFDGDGRLDLLAGNWGRNTPYRASPSHPIRIWYGDFDESGSVDILETSFDASFGQEAPDRDLEALRRAVPSLFAKFPSHAAYAAASLQQVLGDALERSRRVEATVLSSVLLLNREDVWDIRALPDPAQWTPVMGAAVTDVDADGDDDVFLSQNFFPVQPAASRHDAGLGLLLRNEGGGNFSPVPAEESGLRMYGEQRGCAFGDFNQDGRPDLLVGQNGAATRLFENQSARAGLRVHLVGPAANPAAIGAVMRLHCGPWSGPARELRLGGSGLSQGSLVTILGGPPSASDQEEVLELEVRWPGGAVTRTRVPRGANEVAAKTP